MAFFLAAEVRLRSGEAHGAQNLAGGGPARPTVLRISRPARPARLRSGEAHSAQTLAGPVEVWRGSLRSDSRRLRSGEAHCDRELAVF